MLPNFIGIGVQRSGTTWIYEMLKNHPQVCMSPEKEINFFNHHYDRGLEWYKKFFNECSREKVIGEFSPTYLSHNLTAKRIRKIVPEAKLIVSLRNPADQIFSRYCYMITRKKYNKSFDEALKERPFLIENAFYYKHIKRYLEHFDESQILILIYEDLRKDARSFLQKIYSFLDIDDTYIPPKLDERLHFARVPKSKYFETAMVIFQFALRRMGFYSLVELLKNKGPAERIKEFNTKKNIMFEKMDAGTRSELLNLFEYETKMLSALLGRDLSCWD